MSEEQILEIPPSPEPVAAKLAQLRARYTLAAQQQQSLKEQLRQVEAAMGPILGAIMALEELVGG